MRKPTIWFADHFRHKLACILTEACYKLEISDLRRRLIALAAYPILDHKLTDVMNHFFNAIGLHMYEFNHNCVFMNTNEKYMSLVTNNI